MRLRVWQDQLEKMKQALAMGLLLVHKNGCRALLLAYAATQHCRDGLQLNQC